ncbi:MAG: hypothetical protein ACQETG_00405 [Thermodesulfobacteriota bacterium]
MGKKDRIAFGIYLVVALAFLVFAIVYLTCQSFMPYHQQAAGMNWDQISPGMQVLIQALMKMTAAGFFVISFSMLILLFIPFRRGQQWAHRAIALLGLIWSGMSLYVTSVVAVKTQASPPWHAAAAGAALIITAFIISPGSGKKQLTRA